MGAKRQRAENEKKKSGNGVDEAVKMVDIENYSIEKQMKSRLKSKCSRY